MPEDAEQKGLMTFAEACALLQVSERTLRRWCASGLVPHAKLGGILRFREAALWEWIKREEELVRNTRVADRESRRRQR